MTASTCSSWEKVIGRLVYSAVFLLKVSSLKAVLPSNSNFLTVIVPESSGLVSEEGGLGGVVSSGVSGKGCGSGTGCGGGGVGVRGLGRLGELGTWI